VIVTVDNMRRTMHFTDFLIVSRAGLLHFCQLHYLSVTHAII